MGVLLKLGRWLLRKVLTAGLILGLALAAGATWLFLQDPSGHAAVNHAPDGARLAAVWSLAQHYFTTAWTHPLGRLTVQRWTEIAVALYFLGPFFGQLALYFLAAPVIVRGRALRLRATMSELPAVANSEPAVEVTLRPGDRLRARREYVRGVGDGLKRGSRAFLKWRLPITSMAAGLSNLAEIRNLHPAREAEVVLGMPRKAGGELAIVTLRPGVKLVLRPSYLVAVQLAAGDGLKVRKFLRLFHRLAWTSGQFRYLEFEGPCRLVVQGVDIVRPEWLRPKMAAGAAAAIRLESEAVIGFTPALDARPARANSFFGYVAGMTSLFDDEFSGQGLVLREAGVDRARPTRKFWSRVRGQVLKFAGL